MSASLVVVHVDGRQSEVPLTKPLNVLGRATDCAIRIPSGKVSRHHCEVTFNDSKVAVRDLGSSNGTYVNRRRVTQTELAAGDMVCIGVRDRVVVSGKGNPSSHVALGTAKRASDQ